jgi:formate dehydrogenase major subunit
MSTKVNIKIDGKAVEAAAGSTILDAARQVGVYIPTLCHSPLLRPLENCRLCVVQVAGEKKYKASCSTPVTEGMDITTQSEGLHATRKLLLDLLLDTHYGDCVAPCSVTCPANVDIQGYLALIRNGEYLEAVRLVKEKIPMPATIGRVCPHFCEGVCRRRLVEEAININHCKRFIADYEIKSGVRVLPQVAASSGKRVAVIGGGPAGLSAAYYLRILGHGVTIFEAKGKLGGMLRYGIPEYRLPKKLLDWEIDGILGLGVDVKTGVRWGENFTLDDLNKEGYDAIFLAIGAWAARNLGIVGEELEGVVRGIDFLERIADAEQKGIEVGRKVAIIGGGNVAIDAARSALRLGAEKVTILYRRSRKEMPASPEEIEAAEVEGVDIQFLVAPTQIFGDNGSVKKVQFLRMELGEPDASGRRRPVPIEGSEVDIEVDQVISAIGQYPAIPLPESDAALENLPLTRWSTISGDPQSMHTGHGMVFVGGDVFRGPATVVASFADGRKAAYSLDRYFCTGEVQPEPVHFNISKGDLDTIDSEPFSLMQTMSRETMPEMEVRQRVGNFEEVELGLLEEQAKREAGRCLECGCSAAFDCRLRDLMNEFEIDWRAQTSKKIHYQRVAAVDTHPYIALDPNKCIRCERCYTACDTFQVSNAIDFKDWPRFNDRCVNCGLCVDLCPTGALMVRSDKRAVERVDWKTVKSHCIHCGCGCELNLKVIGDRMVWIGDGEKVPPSWAATCQRGRFRTYDPVWRGKRVTTPQIRENGQLKDESWQNAIEALINGFREASDHHGPKSLGALASPQATNEGLYLLQKWMRVGWKSNGVDFPGRVRNELLQQLLQKHGAAGGISRELAALESAKAIFVLGGGVEETTPVMATMIRRAFTSRKASVWQLTSGPDELTPFASIALHTPADLWGEILRELTRVLARSARLSDEDLRKAGLNLPGEKAKRFAPSENSILSEQWEALNGALSAFPDAVFVFSETLLDSKASLEALEALIRLAALAGHVSKAEKPAISVAASQINAAGALLMGATPALLPGFASVKNKKVRKKFQDAWQASELSGDVGSSLEDALEAGQIQALFVQQAALLWEQDAERWEKLLSRVPFLVLQESRPSPAMDLAKVVLPVADYGEQSGTVINLEHRLLGIGRIFSAPGAALADWEILAQILSVQGAPFPKDVPAIHEEIGALVPDLSHVAWQGNLKDVIGTGK